jgi:hypothetical protein
MLEYLLECQLYYNQRIPLFNDLLNMNIQHNIETLMFGNDTHNDLTNSKSFFFYYTHNKILIIPSQQLLMFFFVVDFFSFFVLSLLALIHDAFIDLLFLILYCICFAVIIYDVYCTCKERT